MTIKRIEKEFFVTDDGVEHPTEQDAIQHEQMKTLEKLHDEYDGNIHESFEDFCEFISVFWFEISCYMAGEDLPARESPTPGPKYRHGEQTEAVVPLTMDYDDGSAIYWQPTDAWNAAVSATIRTIEAKIRKDYAYLSDQPSGQRVCGSLITELNEATNHLFVEGKTDES